MYHVRFTVTDLRVPIASASLFFLALLKVLEGRLLGLPSSQYQYYLSLTTVHGKLPYVSVKRCIHSCQLFSYCGVIQNQLHVLGVGDHTYVVFCTYRTEYCNSHSTPSTRDQCFHCGSNTSKDDVCYR